MKIAVIGAKGLPPKQGGIEHYCAELYPRMAERGCSVDIYGRSSYTDSSWFNSYDFEGVHVISLPDLNLRGVDAFMTSALGAIAASGKRYDIIHFHAMGPSLFTLAPRIASKSKIVVTCQGLDWQRAKWGSFSSNLIHLGEKAAVRFAHGMIVVSDALKSYFTQTYGRETVYIPNAPGRYPESDTDFNYGKQLGLTRGRYIVFLGRLVPEKCPDLLVSAFLKLKPPGWKLVLAGGVSDTKTYSAKLLDAIASSRDVVYAGEIWGARKAEIVRGAGLFVLPSDLEGLPLAMLEAMQEGVPVVASDIPPHKQLLNNGRGLLFEAGKVDSCFDSLSWAINHPQQMQQMAQKALNHVHRYYNWDSITSETLKLYATLLNNPEPVTLSSPAPQGLAGILEKK